MILTMAIKITPKRMIVANKDMKGNKRLEKFVAQTMWFFVELTNMYSDCGNVPLLTYVVSC